MSEPTPEQIAKLPKWAQEHMARLEREAKDAKNKLAEFVDGETKSGVWTALGSIHQQKRYIQDDRIHFSVPNGEFEVFPSDGGLEVMASVGGGNFVVVPRVSNVVFLKILP